MPKIISSVGLLCVLLMVACAKETPVAPPIAEPSTPVTEGAADATPSLPAQPTFTNAYVIATPTSFFVDANLTQKYGELPVGAQVSVFGKNPLSTEIRVNTLGRIYRAFVRSDDVFFGDSSLVNDAIAQALCKKNVFRPQNQELVSGMLFDGKILPGYSQPKVSDEDFLNLGLDPIDDPTEEIVSSLPDTPNKITVKASQEADLLVKVKDTDGVVVGMYVRAGQEATASLPDGVFRIYFASGQDFSKTCGKFVAGMTVMKDPDLVTFGTGGSSHMSYDMQSRALSAMDQNTFKPKPVDPEEFN